VSETTLWWGIIRIWNANYIRFEVLTAMKCMTVIVCVRWVVTKLFINSDFLRNFGNNLWRYMEDYSFSRTLFMASLID
jgi:hypothetical protein